MAKMHATETAQAVVDAAVQIFGGLGVKSGHPVERLYREVRALRIYEGATEVQKVIIARELLRVNVERARRHLRARQPAAAGTSGRSSASTCPSCSTRSA